MKNNLIVTAFLLLILSIGCRKDNSSVVMHSGLSRIDYNISQPGEMPNIAFQFNDTYNLNGTTNCSITLITNEQSVSLNLRIMLQDDAGNLTDVSPFIINDNRFFKDNESHSYSYDFENKLGSSTSSTGEINLQKVKKVIIYINAGNTGTVSEGRFWLDKVEFENL